MNDSDHLISVGFKFYTYRKRLKLTQERAAERLSISTRQYGRIENGEVGMSITILRNAVKAFGLTELQLWELMK